MDDENVAIKLTEAVFKQDSKTTIAYMGGDYETLSNLLMFRPSAAISYSAQQTDLMRTIYSLYKEQQKHNHHFLIRNRDEIERIPYEQIDCFESSNRKVYLHTSADTKIYEFNAKIDDVMKSITAPNFIRCHQSFLVNLANVRRIDKTARQFIMFSGKTADISKRSLTEVSDYFEKYAKSGQ
jgi:DNA-binding LytR/AlgR family response regulator